MTIREMQEKKRELGLTNEMISAQAGVPLATVQKIFAGVTKAPRRDTIQKLEAVLSKENASNTSMAGKSAQGASNYSAQSPSVMVREALSANADPATGGYTIEDYYALPDDRRVELIDGVFYDMASPGKVHQVILLQLGVQFDSCLEQHENCELFIAPFDVCLNKDNRTMVQPDLLIVCNQKDDDKRRFNGAPDFIIEILSPSSRTHDMFRKLNKYRFAGVREYWIIDPEVLKILVYDLEHEKIPEQYSFEDTVPVLISGGTCSIDFKKILERIRRYL